MHRDPPEANMAQGVSIAIVSPNDGTAQHLRQLLNGFGSSLTINQVRGGIEQVARVAAERKPDLIFVEGTRHDETELLALESVTPRHPETAFVMLSPNQSAAFLRHGMRIGLREILPIPAPKELLLEAVGSVQKRVSLNAKPKKKGEVLAFLGCKGGSGATFLSTNLGYALAEQSKRVAVLDLNFQFGDASLYVSERVPQTTIADVAREIHRLDPAFLEASMIQAAPGLGVLAAPEEPDQALHVKPEHVDAILWTATSSYDFVIVDLGRTLDDLTVRALDQASLIFPVMQLTLPFVRDGKRLLQALASLGYGKDKIRLVVNRHEKSAVITLEELSQTLRLEVFRTIPNSFTNVSASINQGVPIGRLAGRDPVAKAVKEMAGILAPAEKSSGWLRGILGSK